jgi:hypothetical protein
MIEASLDEAIKEKSTMNTHFCVRMTIQLFVLSAPSWTREFLQIYWAGTHVDLMTLVGCLNFKCKSKKTA